ncbi:hypothetical protein RGI145_23840 (plasmid) [Roseomonas gilardii]|jgi:site-specific recombinase XerC|uniref:Tyr recombinase domain-containing protein n=1 Tax=Roseomonas gilardii TaxID=257708 RepID=A0A1L7ANQ8_9PROT|nr:tyrosine-type recombinase/integrase [Roseomonas gilardii]APT60379.1 hypothetical protein RGI145_23840 [Roseomonas gilardii]
MSTPRPRLCWPLSWWPEADRLAWLLHCTPGDPFHDDRPGARHRTATLIALVKAYGRWLAFLASRGWLDPDEPPLARVTRARLRAFFHELRRVGNADHTVIGRFSHLAMALAVIVPGAEVSWIRRPDGVSVHSLLPKNTRTLVVPDGQVILDWGVTMMRQARARLERGGDRNALTAYRDGLLIVLLALCGRRLRSVSLLRPGHELRQVGECFRVEFTPAQTKTKRRDRFGLHEGFTPWMRHYLEVIRPALLVGQRQEALWIGRLGEPLSAQGIQTRIQRLSRQRFGISFGPHRIRHSIVTTAALRLGATPSFGAAVVGNTPAVAEGYNHAGQCRAAALYAQVIRERRRNNGR